MQEALRRRHLYFGDIDGRTNAELTNAIKQYQERQGFTVTGAVDNDTALSLGLSTTITVATTKPPLPDIPVLKSDFSRELTADQRRHLEQQPESMEIAPPPAESPAALDNLTPERVTKFVEEYLRDGESNEPTAQLKYFTFPVDYFEDGSQGAGYVQRDSERQAKAWPERKFVLAGPVQFHSLGNPGEFAVEFLYAFEERGRKGVAIGNARQQLRVRTEGDQLKITKVKEQIERQTPHAHSGTTP